MLSASVRPPFLSTRYTFPQCVWGRATPILRASFIKYKFETQNIHLKRSKFSYLVLTFLLFHNHIFSCIKIYPSRYLSNTSNPTYSNKLFLMFNCMIIQIYQTGNFTMTFIFFFPHPTDNWMSGPVISIGETLLLFYRMSLFPYNLDSHYLFPSFAQWIPLSLFLWKITFMFVVENICQEKRKSSKKIVFF